MRQRGTRLIIALGLLLGSIGTWPSGAGAYGVGSWSSTGEMQSARYAATATPLSNGMILVAGGLDGAPLKTAELYDPESGTWRITGSMQAGRSHHTATRLADSRVLIAGGYNGTYLDSVEIYEPVSGTWQGAASMQYRRNDHQSVLLPDGRLFVIGGTNGPSDAMIPANSGELYDPVVDRWTTTAASTINDISPLSATLLADGSVLVVGTRTSGVSSAQRYDPVANSWSITGGPTERYTAMLTAIALPGGKVLIAGGGTSNAELYDPANGIWSSAGTMRSSRVFGQTAELLGDGRVIVIGGCCRSNSVEIYDPASNSWSNTGTLLEGRQFHVSAPLPNGKILAAGGQNGNNSFTTSAELFSLSGAVVALTPTSLTFGRQPLNTASNPQTVTLTNAGSTPITIASVAIVGTNPSDFATGADTCARANVAPGQTCSVSVNFAPRFSGQRVATLTITDDAPGSPHAVALLGAGTIAPTISAIDPTHARAGTGAFTLVVSGTNFSPGATVRWKGADRPTTFIDSTRLTAAIGAADIADSAVDDLSVFNPGPDGADSNPYPFFVTANGTAVTGSASGTSTAADGTVIASMGGTGPGTAGSLTAIAFGQGTITVAGYGGNPGGAPNFGTGTSGAVGGYLDIHAATGSSFRNVQIVNCALNNASAVFWWDGTAWIRASNQEISSPGCVTVMVTATSSPSVNQLDGTYLAAGRQLTFSDLPANHPAYEAIRELSARGIIRGYSDGTFGPRDFTLRAQMAALITRAMGWDTGDPGNPFPDRGVIDNELWRNIGALQARGVAQGYSDGTYNPTGDVLAAQSVLFISRAMIAKGYWTPQPDNASLYPDIPGTSARQQADRRDIATYVHYAGALPDMPTANGQQFVGWDKPATRAWFARALWQALVSYYGSAAQVP